MKKTSKQLVEEAMSEIKTVSASDAVALLGKDGVVFVDLRDPRELQREGQIPGAFSCPRGLLEFWIDSASPYYKPIFDGGKRYIFYCASGWRSALATKTAQDMTGLDVAHIGGGFTAWKAGKGATAQPEAEKSA